ncbi:MAG: ABC transporter substrate-binding protein [Alphaproteobacteria bacterium]|nr:ABC transporter substrate-binding protein [Alphaproteobacteria bacterium]
MSVASKLCRAGWRFGRAWPLVLLLLVAACEGQGLPSLSGLTRPLGSENPPKPAKEAPPAATPKIQPPAKVETASLPPSQQQPLPQQPFTLPQSLPPAQPDGLPAQAIRTPDMIYVPPGESVPNVLASLPPSAMPSLPATTGGQRLRAALLVPLSGPSASLGKSLLNAAQLALFEMSGAGFSLLPIDTKGTPEGAAAAARQALDHGAQVIL